MQGGGSESKASAMPIYLILGAAVTFGLSYLAKQYSAEILQWMWRPVRTIQLLPSLDFSLIQKMWSYPWNKGMDDPRVLFVDNKAAWTMRVMIIIVGFFAISKMVKLGVHKSVVRGASPWTMDEHLDALYPRFKENLKFVFKPPRGWVMAPYKFNLGFTTLTIKLPYYVSYVYPNLGFRKYIEPLDFLKEKESQPGDAVEETFRDQIGPLLRIKDGKIVWQEKGCEYLVKRAVKHIRDKAPKEDDIIERDEFNRIVSVKKGDNKVWQNKAWRSAVDNHIYERTFALGVMMEARNFGVFPSSCLLEIRDMAKQEEAEELRKAVIEYKKTNKKKTITKSEEDKIRGTLKSTPSHTLWMAVSSLGGDTCFVEGIGLTNHFWLEREVSDFARRKKEKGEPESEQLIRQIKQSVNPRKSIEALSDIKIKAAGTEVGLHRKSLIASLGSTMGQRNQEEMAKNETQAPPPRTTTPARRQGGNA